MTGAPGARLRERARAALRLALAALLASSAAYQVLLPATIDLGRPGPLPVAAEGVHPAEEGYRWTGESAVLVLPAPAGGRQVAVEATLSAWRPRGRPLPVVRLTAGGASRTAPASATPAAHTLVAHAPWSWDGRLALRLDTEAFEPGRGDPRRLGVRLHHLRLSSPSGAFAPGLPPPGPVLAAAAAVALLFGVLMAVGVPEVSAHRASLLAAAGAAAALVAARPWTVRLLPAAAGLLAVLLALVSLWPAPARRLAAVAREAARRLAEAARRLGPAPLAALVLLAAAGTALGYRAPTEVVIPLGTGREAAFEEGLGAFDSVGGERFRHLASGAALDLGDLGSGPWRATVTAAVAGAPRVMPLVDLGGVVSEARLGPEWTSHVVAAHAPLGWRSGLRLGFPVPRREDVWLREVRVSRQRAWPSLRVVAWVAVAGAAVALALLAAGLGRGPAGAAGAVVVLLESAALAVDPVAAVPHVPRLAAIAAAGAALTALLAAALPAGSSLRPAAAAAGAGFMAWLASAAAPLYRGGHFVFHSSIAEEIWKGRFLVYYLPYPGSMLSRQAQWGDVVVPHPCLYHVVASPLAALPRAAFYSLEKALLALLLAAMVLACAALGARLGGARAGTAAAVLMASMPASYQLLGLGHLMTIFGCWAMAMAVTYAALHWERLHERRWWRRAVLLLALSYLAYFAGLLFMALVLALSAALLARPHPVLARALLTAGLAAAALAFILYYVNWTWPFLSESVPRLLGGSGSQSAGAAGALPARLAAVPHKLAYTFGSALVPVLGLAGLLLARRGPEKVLLLSWAALLPLFLGLDLFFNFLLKHHYYTMAPVAVGGGVLLARLAEKGRWGRVLSVASLLAVAFLGARVALDVAMGRIP